MWLEVAVNTLKDFWLILGQRKTRLVVFLWKKKNKFSCFFELNIISNGLIWLKCFKVLRSCWSHQLFIIIIFLQILIYLTYSKPLVLKQINYVILRILLLLFSAELGDYESDQHSPGTISEFRFCPEQDEKMEEDILEKYKELR